MEMLSDIVGLSRYPSELISEIFSYLTLQEVEPFLHVADMRENALRRYYSKICATSIDQNTLRKDYALIHRAGNSAIHETHYERRVPYLGLDSDRYAHCLPDESDYLCCGLADFKSLLDKCPVTPNVVIISSESVIEMIILLTSQKERLQKVAKLEIYMNQYQPCPQSAIQEYFQILRTFSNLKTLQLPRFMNLDITAIGKLSSLEVLYIEDNEIQDISGLSSLKNLKDLSFHNSRIPFQSLNSLFFEMGNLQALDLSKCRKLEWCISTIKFPPQLKVLKLNCISLDGKLGELSLFKGNEKSNLEVLELQYCNLQSMDEISFPKNLHSLDVTGNYLTGLGKTLLSSQLQDLKITGVFDRINLSLLPRSLKNLAIETRAKLTTVYGNLPNNLVSMDMRVYESGWFYSGTLDIPNSVRKLILHSFKMIGKITLNKDIEYAELRACVPLNNNNFSLLRESCPDDTFTDLLEIYSSLPNQEVIPSSMFEGQFANLKELKLNFCHQEACKFVENAINLKFLDLSDNCIEDIRNIQFPQSLKRLSLDRNRIKSLKNVRFPDSIIELKLDQNQIEETQKVHFPLQIISLNLCVNMIHEFNSTNIGFCEKLQNLFIARNELQEIRGVRFPSHIRILDLESNHIHTLEGILLPHNLEELLLGNNNIIDIEKVEVPEKVKILSLQGNQIVDVKGIELPNSLTDLRLERNHIRDAKGLKLPKSLVRLDLSFNPLSSIDELKLCNNLEYIRVSNSVISDVGHTEWPLGLGVLVISKNSKSSNEGDVNQTKRDFGIRYVL